MLRFPVTRAQALAAGFTPAVTRRMLAAGEWTVLRRGVYVDAATLADVAADAERRHALRVAGLLLVSGRDAVAGGTSAARICGLDSLAALPDELSLLAPDLRGRVVRRTGYVIQPVSVPLHHRTVRHGVPITSAARTVVDLARGGSLMDAVVLIDSALRKGHATVEQLQEVLSTCHVWPGIRCARQAVGLADPASESVLESASRVVMFEHGLPLPRSQVIVRDSAGFVARVDFLWEEFGVVGEADGLAKYEPDARRSTRDIVRAEKRREERLTDAGYEVIRWGWDDVRAPVQLARRLRAAFARGAARQ